MFSKNKSKDPTEKEAREQYEYAQQRIAKKKNLMRHFVVFLVGSVLLIIINPILGYGDTFFIKDWFIWAILIWTFIFLIHLVNVFLINKFMGQEWEDRQLEKLKTLQEVRVAELKKQALQEVTVKENKIAKEQEALKDMTSSTKTELPDVKKNNPNQLPENQE
jgi:hypothetical protein